MLTKKHTQKRGVFIYPILPIKTPPFNERMTNMASITKRNGKWQAKIRYYDTDGKRRSKSKAGFKTKREAQLFANEYELKAGENELGPNSTITLPDYFEQWYKLYKASVVSLKTKKNYEYTLRILRKYFANVALTEIDQKQYQLFLQKYGMNRSKQTTAKVNTHIHAAVKSAIYDGVIKKDFVARTSLVYDKKRTQKIEYLNINEMTKLVNYLTSQLDPRYTSKYMIILAVYTGMRLGEIQGLQWKNINFNFKTISIEHAWSELERDFKETKNESSRRIIRVNDDLVTILKGLRKSVNPTAKQNVFLNKEGTVPTSNGVNKTLRKALKELEIDKPSFHFHSLRHMHVAYLLANQIDLYAISKRLGHSDIGTTSRVYSYMIDEYKIRTDQQIESVLQNINKSEVCPERAQKI